jgi:predicted type IV restriction endonuclease
MRTDTIPDAVAAVIQGVLDSRPTCDPGARGRLIVRELRALGWRIEAPEIAAARSPEPGQGRRRPAEAASRAARNRGAGTA